MIKRLCLATLLLTTTLTAPAMAAPATGVVAEVNGHKITRAFYDAYTRQRYPQVAGELHRAIVEEIVNIILVLQESERNGFTNRPEVKADLEVMRSSFITNAAISDHLATTPPSDKEIEAEYQNHYANTLATEFKARHILLKSDGDAMDVIEELDEGANFALLAQKLSIDPSAEKGGQLGWFLPEQMVPTFAAAVAKLEKGQYSAKPIRTRFGWHIIQLEDRRKVPPPPLEQVKSKLVSQIQDRQVGAFIASLRDKAKVKVQVPAQ